MSREHRGKAVEILSLESAGPPAWEIEDQRKRDKTIVRLGVKLARGPCGQAFKRALAQAHVPAQGWPYKQQDPRQTYFDSHKLHNVIRWGGGLRMEEETQLFAIATKELTEAHKAMMNAYNSLCAIDDKLRDMLAERVEKIRMNRMTVEREMNQCLHVMKDVRKFFLEADYELEMNRLERFVAVVKAFGELKTNGTLDAVTDAMIRLAVQE